MNSPAERITEYLSLGGLFNPEMMNHDAVSALLIDCRAELSRLSALVAEWRTMGDEAEAQMVALYISISPHATYERDGKIGNRFADSDNAVINLRRLSQLKDTTNADK